MDDELFYEQAAAEVAADRIQAGLYAKAFSQADGDKTVAQARYLRLRAEQLAAEAMLAKQLAAEAMLAKEAMAKATSKERLESSCVLVMAVIVVILLALVVIVNLGP
jgi:hypothetical protein